MSLSDELRRRRAAIGKQPQDRATKRRPLKNSWATKKRRPKALPNYSRIPDRKWTDRELGA